MVKVKFMGIGTQYHPRLGELIEGHIYIFEQGTYSPALFEVVEEDSAAEEDIWNRPFEEDQE